MDTSLLDDAQHIISSPKPRDYGSLSSQNTIDQPKRQIGVVSAVFIIFNRIIGTGIFATPSTILGFSGSVGLSLIMWLIGALIASAGMQVYIIWGTALPRNGGEKNYLEFLFPWPKRLVTSMYAANAVLLAYAAGNALVFAEYALASIYADHPTPAEDLFSPVRIVAFLCLTGVLLLHGLHIPSGLRLQNTLGFLKIGILGVVVTAGFLALSGNLQEGVERPGNFDSWEKIWHGSKSGGNVLCACLYNVIWSYVGFSNANYALSEMRNPERTLRIAGPLAMITVTIFYTLCNIAYFAAASKEEITSSGRLVAALLFRNVWGERTERILNGFVALSALGNVLSVLFSQGRVNQELGKENVLPFSKFWASQWPANAPLAGLGLQWLMCNIVIFAVPEGDAYNFVINVISYPLAVINATISTGLLYLSLQNYRLAGNSKSKPLVASYLVAPSSSAPQYSAIPNLSSESTSDRRSSSIRNTPEIASLLPPPPTTYSGPPETYAQSQEQFLTFSPTPSLLIPASLFAIANVFLFIVPLTKPPPGVEPYQHLPYWTHAAGGWGIFAIGTLWWAVRGRGQEESSRGFRRDSI